MSFVSFPTENLAQVLIPYDGAVLALFDKGNHLIYATEQSDILDDISAGRLSENLQEDQDYFHYTKDGREYLVNHVTMAGTGWRMVNWYPCPYHPGSGQASQHCNLPDGPHGPGSLHGLPCHVFLCQRAS